MIDIFYKALCFCPSLLPMQDFKNMINDNIATGKYKADATGEENNTVLLLIVRHRVLMVLINNRKKGLPPKWGLPGGKINAGETPFPAAIRELQEETGVVFRKDCYDRANELKFTWLDTRFYVARYDDRHVWAAKSFVDPTG